MMRTSHATAGQRVSFPEFTGERVYMRRIERVLPPDLSRWQATVDAMLIGVCFDGPMYLMIDQKPVLAGATHRRAGAHVDMYWHEVLRAHGGGGQHYPSPPSPPPKPQPKPNPKPKGEALILAYDSGPALSLEGVWSGSHGANGELSRRDENRLEQRALAPGLAWLGEAGSWAHASVNAVVDMERTLVRLNVQGWSPCVMH